MRLDRRNTLLIVLAVGVVTVAGLAIHGVVGGVLLVLVAATLILMTSGAGWDDARWDSRAVRGGIVALVLLVAILKFTGRT